MKNDNPARKMFEPLLSPYVDGELDPKERQAVEQHLAHNPQSAAQVADMRAAGGLLRAALDLEADQVDWKDFTQNVMSRLAPEKLPFFERVRLQVSEMFIYQRPLFITSLATAAAVALIAVPLAMRAGAAGVPTGYANARPEVQTVSVEQNAEVRPVVMETDDGDAIIWMMEPPRKPGPSLEEDKNEELGIEHPAAGPPDASQAAPPNSNQGSL